MIYFSPMAQTMTTNNFCEACNVSVHQNVLQQHVNGKKHKFKQEQYDKKFKTIFVTGTSKFSPKDLEKIFMKYGEISKVQKQAIKPFAFIQFVDKDSVERALNARVFAGGKRLFVHRYIDNRNRAYSQEDEKEKSRKLSETLSSTSLSEGDTEKGPWVGVKELPVEIAEPDWCTQGDVVLWQAQDFISQVELSAEKYESLYEVLSDMENLFRPVIPGCQVIVFGSCGSTLAFKNSDVDLFLQTPDGNQLIDFVRREAKEMYRSRLFRVITRIPTARVPIVKFEHIRTGWQGDLTANSQLGVCNSQLIRFLVSLNPRIKPLMMVIKYWAKVVEVTGSHNRFTTYSLVMLVIFYLQQLDPPALPTIAQLQQMTEHKQFSLGWECSFCDEEWRVQSECLPRQNDLSLRQLLTGFFRFYRDFDFSNVICPLLGRSIPGRDFESDGTDLPDEMSLYRENLKRDPKCKFRTDVNFKMQDPFELCLNITRNVAERTFSVFKEACRVSLELCEKEEDSMLLKSLFSIDAESLIVAEDCVKLNINVKEQVSDSSEASESLIAQLYELTIDSIMLVLKQIFKLDVEPCSGEVLSKVKKLESSQDVHSTTNNQDEKLVLLCSGKADVWQSRRKMCRFMNSIKIALNPFEKEVCISNALYHPSDQKKFNFTLTVSSLEDLKKDGRHIEVLVKMKQSRQPLIKGFIQSMKSDFKVFVIKARDFIDKVKSSSPLTEVKQSLKELFELKLENLPDLIELKKKEKTLSDKGKDDKFVEKQNVLMNLLNKGGASTDIKFKTTPLSSETGYAKSPEVGSSDTKSLEEKFEKSSPSEEKIISDDLIENKLMKSILSPKNMSSTETQKLIDEFFKPKSPNQGTDIMKGKHLSSPEVDKFYDLLNSIKKIETKSTFTSDSGNPFLASIEKATLNSFTIEKETKELNQSGEKGTCSEAQENLKNINENKETEIVENPQEQEHTSLGRKNQREISDNNNEETEPSIKTESGKDKTSPSTSQENADETDVVKEVINDESLHKHMGDTNICFQRPKIHSERPLKQKKPNSSRFHRNVSERQPWVGGGPPGCQPWRSQQQPCYPATQNHQNSQGNNHEETRRHNPSNQNILWQKKCYPGLFKDGI